MTVSDERQTAPLREVTATRFVVALREGGSLPGVVEGDDGRLWVTKFRGAGQGAGALLAELVAGQLARTLGLPMPELVRLVLPPRFGVADGDREVNDLLAASIGDNVGMAFLPEAIGYDPAAQMPVDPELAARIVAFDVLLSNVDRTFRNPNLLWSGAQLWLIDHGAALYWQHGWDGDLRGATTPLPRMKDHVLWPLAGDLATAATWVARQVDHAALVAALAVVPEAWLLTDKGTSALRRSAFVNLLAARLATLVELVAGPPR